MGRPSELHWDHQIFPAAGQHQLEIVIRIEVDAHGVRAFWHLDACDDDREIGVEFADRFPQPVELRERRPLSGVEICVVIVKRFVAERELSRAFDG